MSLHKLILLLIVLSFPLTSQAQLLQTKRTEIELDHPSETYLTYPLGKKGIAVFRNQSQGFLKGTNKLEILRMDTSLQTLWAKKYEIDNSHKLLGYTADQEQLYLLFDENKMGKQYFLLYTADLENGMMQKYRIFKSFKLELSHFEVIDGRALIGGHYNNRPVVLNYNPASKQTEVLEGLYRQKSEMKDIQIDSANNVFNIILKIDSKSLKDQLTLNTYLSSGEMLKSVNLPNDGNNDYMIDGKSTTFKGTKQLIVGTFTKGYKYPEGFFTLKLQAGNPLSEPKMHGYGDLEHFFDYMKPRRAERKQRKAKRRHRKNKSLNYGYYVHLQDIIEQEDKYYMVAEIYEVRNKNNHYQPDHIFGRGFYDPVPNQDDDFEGYDIVQAVVLCFNTQGELLWDRSVEVNKILGKTMMDYVHLFVEKNDVALVYHHDENYHVKRFYDNGSEPDKEEIPIRLEDYQEKLSLFFEARQEIKYWYDDALYATGTQKIKNPDSDKNRTVFFITKLEYDFFGLSYQGRDKEENPAEEPVN